MLNWFEQHGKDRALGKGVDSHYTEMRVNNFNKRGLLALFVIRTTKKNFSKAPMSLHTT